MSKRPITVKNPNDKNDKIGINLNEFDYRAVQFLKISPHNTMSDIAFKIIASETGVGEDEVSIDYLRKYSDEVGLPYSEAFRKMLITYLKKNLAERKYDLRFAHNKIYGKTETELFNVFLDYINSDNKIKDLDIIKLHYLEGWSLRKIAIKKNKSPEFIRMSKEEALRQIRIAVAKKGISSMLSLNEVKENLNAQ